MTEYGHEDNDEYEEFLIEHFNLCGCSECDPVVVVLRGLLEWIGSDSECRCQYDSLFDGNRGIYYLLVGMLDRKGYCEHGTSIRCPWLEEKGERLLKFLEKDKETVVQGE